MAVPFAYLAIKGINCDGVCAHSISRKSREEFISEFLADGYSILPVATRDEYNAKIQELNGLIGKAKASEVQS